MHRSAPPGRRSDGPALLELETGVPVEGAWSYYDPARVSEVLRRRIAKVTKADRAIAWKAQVRLCARYRRLAAASNKTQLVIAAIAREMASVSPPASARSAMEIDWFWGDSHHPKGRIYDSTMRNSPIKSPRTMRIVSSSSLTTRSVWTISALCSMPFLPL